MAKTWHNAITDVPGIRVGHATNQEAMTGCTVVLCPPQGAVGGVDQRGGAPGTRETDLLRPMHLVQRIHAVLLSGGSAFGLDAASGVVRWLEKRGIGYDTGVARVPIVPGAVIFDLNLGRADVRPDATMGYAACDAATDGPVTEGSVGIGTGCKVGAVFGAARSTKAGVGTASIDLGGGLVVGAIVAVNAFGDVRDPSTGKILAGARIANDSMAFADTRELMRRGVPRPASAFQSTTIGVIVTNAKLDKQGASLVAKMASLGMLKTVSPGHTLYDGDIVFSLSSGQIEVDYQTVGLMAEEVLAQAIVRGITKAEAVKGIPSYLSLEQST